jgi:hypothetical protein
MMHWTMGKVLALLTVANLVLGVTLLATGGGTSQVEAIAPPPKLPAQLVELASSIDEGRHGEAYELVLSEEELTAAAAYFLSFTPEVRFTRLKISISGEKVTIDGVTKGLPITTPVRVTGTVLARGGLPQASVDDVGLGETALPGFLRDRIVQEINANLDFSRYPLALSVDVLELRPGYVTIRGRIK